MKVISVYIQLNTITLLYCQSFEIESSWDNFTDNAKVIVPNVIFKSETSNASVGLDALLKKGDPIEIRAGYNKPSDELETLFKGFISNIKTGTILEISAQDAMYALKQKNVPSKLFKDAKLSELIDYCLEGIKLDVEYTKVADKDVGLGDWAIENNSFQSPLAVFQQLKDWGIIITVRDGKLVVGQPYDATGITHYFVKEINIIEDSLTNELNDTARVIKGIYRNDKNEKIIKYVSKINEKILVTTDELQGTITKTLNFYNISESDFDKLLEKAYQSTNYKGFKGDIVTFGEPYVKYNDWIKLRDLKNPERNGTYKVRSVKYEMSTSSGLRQTITTDFAISEIQANS